MSPRAWTSKSMPALEIVEQIDESERLDQIDRWCRELQPSGRFNGGVLIARHGKSLLMKTYGVADL